MRDPLFLESEAYFSSCGLYRWSLKRILTYNKNTLIFIGLNPSKASRKQDDPTLRRLIKFAYSWGYGSLIVVNLFARVSSSPSIIKRCSDPVGKKNDQVLLSHFFEWSQDPSCDLWLGWGNQGVWKNRNLDVMTFLKTSAINRGCQFPTALGPLALGLTMQGHPLHPLYISQKKGFNTF